MLGFKSHLKEADVYVGRTITLCCEADTENATATWMKGNRILQDGGRISISKRETHFTLEIRNAKTEDSGQYSIKLTNTYGTDISSALVIVLGTYDLN